MVRVLLLSLLLTGCAAYVPFDAPSGSRSRYIEWRVVDDADRVCRSKMKKEYPPYPLMVVNACAEYTKDWCVIYTNKRTDLHELGHEIRHCYDGKWHD